MPSGAWYGRALAVGGAICLLVPALFMWGFTVDDALIPLRYAHHLATGSGYRFNAHGPVTDGVTPLPWAFLLAPLAKGDLVVALGRVKVLSVVALGLSGAALGRFLARRAGGRRRATIDAVLALVVVGLAFPIGAWAASGMETGIATALTTFAVVSFERPKRLAAIAGALAALRPELVVWALAVAAGAAIARERASKAPRAQLRVAAEAASVASIAAFPFGVCAIARVIVFGRAFPLALLAKPSDLRHGLVYAGAASVVVLTPLLVLAPVALARATDLAKVLVVAAVAHVVVVMAVGGDWMPYARLLVPIAPTLAVVHVELSGVAHVAAGTGRALAAIALGVALAVSGAPAGRRVQRDREELIATARPILADARVVAALDVGWVGAASEADLVDLAGLTDPAIAALPGGHTSKSVDVGMLIDRNVDTVVIYSAGDPASTPMRAVESRIVRAELFATHFERVADIRFGERGASYAVFRLTPAGR